MPHTSAATRTHHPARRIGRGTSRQSPANLRIPVDENTVDVTVGNRTVRLTNLHKPFWPQLHITKGDLLRYYADIAHVLLPHLIDRAMVMKRYPHGVG